jgi:hypothetical protein
MKIQRIAIGITVANLVLMTILLAQFRTVNAKQQQNFIEPVLRGRSLEIVDSIGKVRASISIQPPVTMNGKQYPETVLLRLTNEQGKPVVKIGAARDGAGISLVNTNDQGVLVHATDDGSDIKITDKGKEKVVQP